MLRIIFKLCLIAMFQNRGFKINKNNCNEIPIFVMIEKVMIFLAGLVDNWRILRDSGFCRIYHKTLTDIIHSWML